MVLCISGYIASARERNYKKKVQKDENKELVILINALLLEFNGQIKLFLSFYQRLNLSVSQNTIL